MRPDALGGRIRSSGDDGLVVQQRVTKVRARLQQLALASQLQGFPSLVGLQILTLQADEQEPDERNDRILAHQRVQRTDVLVFALVPRVQPSGKITAVIWWPQCRSYGEQQAARSQAAAVRNTLSTESLRERSQGAEQKQPSGCPRKALSVSLTSSPSTRRPRARARS